MNKRYIIEYTGDPRLMQNELERKGAKVPFNSHSNKVAIASVPESVIEEIRGLEGITGFKEEPL